MADLSQLSNDALLSALGPAPQAAHTPAAFVAQHQGTAAAAGQQLGVDPNLLLAQWGLETGWGKSTVPGTNNLGNIKDMSGGGVAATDNATGSTDNYRQYPTPDAFAQDQASLLARKYPGVVGAGSDVTKFASGLHGYAEDPQYAQKLAAVAQTVQRNQPQAAQQHQPGFLARAGDVVASAISGTANAATPHDLSGISNEDLLAALGSRGAAPQGQPAAQDQQAPGSLSGFVGQLGHQIGLSARAAGHGIADAAGLIVNPVNATINLAGRAIGHDPQLQDVDTLIRRGVDAITPDPQNNVERGVGDVASAVANPVNLIGGPIMEGAGGIVSTLGRGAAAGGLTAGMQPLHGDDTLGTEAQRIAGGTVGGVVGAAGGAALGAAAQKIMGGVTRVVAQLPATQAAAKVNADSVIQQAAQDQGIDLAAIPQSMINSMRSQVQDALANRATVDPAALLRRGEGEVVLGANNGLTLGQATRDPMQFAQERNLRGIQGAGQPLTERFANQNTALIDSLNKQGASQAGGEYTTGQEAIDALAREDAKAQAGVSGLYSQAHAINGNDIPLDHQAFVTQARNNLTDQLRDLHLPSSVSKQLDRFESGETPLNVGTADQFKSILGTDMASAEASGKMNVVSALGIVRKALDDAPPLLGGEAQQGVDAMAAFNKARAVAKERFDTIDAVPALQAVVNGKAAPDNFFNRYVLNGKVADVNALIGIVPDQGQALRAQVVDHLKSAALSGSSDEVGVFSQSGYNKALNSIGNAKLNVLFSPDQVSALKQIGRVAANIQKEPAGSAVNHSNSAGAVVNSLTGLAGTLRLPGLNLAKNSINQFVNERAAQQALAAQVPVAAESRPLDSLNHLITVLPGIAGGATVPLAR